MAGIIDSCKDEMNKRIAGFDKDLLKIRTGRASISILDNVKVDYYGTLSPLSQVATLSTPDARTILISPFEKKLIQEIEKSIMKADLGLQPNSDGVVVRVPVPQLTEERRKDIVKQLKKTGEDAKVSIRTIRRDSNEEVKKQEKDKKITEDDSKRMQDEVQKLTDQFIKVLDERMAKKEKEVMTV
jgi:ribosome recycling factor